MLKSLILVIFAATSALAAGGASAEADRHPGIYQFAPVPDGFCAGRPPPAALPGAPPRLMRLGDLPPAYVIRLSAPAAPAAGGTTVLRAPTPDAHPAGYDPCARVSPTLVRVR